MPATRCGSSPAIRPTSGRASPVARRRRVDIDQRVDAQAGFDERVRPHATRVIDTSGEPATTRAIVDRAFDEALSSARASPPV